MTHQFLFRDEVKQAHISGSYAVAFEAAAEDLAGLSFNQGYQLVLDASKGDPLYFDALALMWLHQGILERRFTLYLAGHVAQNLHYLPDYHQGEIARRGLMNVLDPF